jgi:hypothetical protein
MELRHSKDWAILNDKLICVTKREVSMQRGEIMWKKHWQNEDGGWEKVRGMAALKVEKKRGGGRGEARRGPDKPWIGGGDKESTLAVPTLFE